MPERSREGVLIVNADDWGRDAETTARIAECLVPGGVSSVSAMVFMEDSEPASMLARERGVDAGLHLNFTTPFTAPRLPAALIERQERVGRYLRSHRAARFIFNPAIAGDVRYVVAAQLDEFERLYGERPGRIDGHHHMHLCANVIAAGLLPPGTLVRRNFCFEPGEKSSWNRLCRRSLDRVLARRHRLTDFFFALAPIEPVARLQRVCSLARRAVVELETHPACADEYQFLRSGQIMRHDPGVRTAPFSALRAHAASLERAS